MTGRIVLKENQKEVLAQFYSNFALAWLTFGLVAPIFVGMGNPVVFIVKFFTALIFTVLCLKFSLDFLK